MDSIVERLKKFRAKKGAPMEASDIDKLLDEVVAALSAASGHQEMVDEIRAIASRIQKTKQDLRKISGDRSGQEHIKGANLELDEVIKATEEASNRIMDSAEKIQSLSVGNDAVIAEVTNIFEACSFQDITGQRIRKVLGLLLDIEKAIFHLIELAGGTPSNTALSGEKKKKSLTQAEKEKELLRGPQLGKDMPSQDDIDKLFAESK